MMMTCYCSHLQNDRAIIGTTVIVDNHTHTRTHTALLLVSAHGAV